MAGETLDLAQFLFAATASEPEPDWQAADDLDFLAGPAAAEVPPAVRLPPGHPRRLAGEALASKVQPADLLPLLGDPRIQRADGEALAIVCVAALGAGGAGAAWAAALTRAVQSPDLALALLGAAAVAELGLAALQEPFAACFGRHLPALNRDDRAKFLDFLEHHGDGRCVRGLEQALAQHGALLDDAQAWRARHIVQVIRRAGRK